MGAAVDATLGAADAVFFGRKTYDSFAGAWPEREAPRSNYERADSTACAVSRSIGTMSSARACVAPSTTGGAQPAR